MDYNKAALELHSKFPGKIAVQSLCECKDRDALSTAYTPGVAQPCLEIQQDPAERYALTRRHNLVAVITDGSAVLGLGDIGPEAGMPVMEGKCVLFKAFGGVDAVPLCIRSHDVDEIVNTVALLAGSFGGVNLEDISAPRCFEIERKLKERCDIPIFHDDQHGTAIITLAGLTNALKVVGKKMDAVRIVINGAGAAVVSTGRSDYPNQINNVLAFPGIFRGALDVRASDINEEMKMAAAMALAAVIPEEELSEENIIPKPFDPRVVPAVAAAVAEAARKTGVARTLS